MNAETEKVLAEAEKAGTIEDKIKVFWGVDGNYVFRLGERHAWKRAHAVVKIKIATAVVAGVGIAELLRALL